MYGVKIMISDVGMVWYVKRCDSVSPAIFACLKQKT